MSNHESSKPVPDWFANAHKAATPPPPTLADQVKAIETENEQLTKLFGEFMATIRVNWLRGTLIIEPKEASGNFETIIDGFSKRFQTIRTGGPHA